MPSLWTRTQHVFDPTAFCFKWTKDWYEWDRDAAHAEAKAARAAKAKELKAKGVSFRLATLPNQRLTMGGIGTEHPEIDLNCTVYMIVPTTNPKG